MLLYFSLRASAICFTFYSIPILNKVKLAIFSQPALRHGRTIHQNTNKAHRSVNILLDSKSKFSIITITLQKKLNPHPTNSHTNTNTNKTHIK